MRGSGTVTKNWHPVMVKDETGSWPPLAEAMEYLHLHPMEYFRNSRVLETAYGAELQLIDLTLTFAQRMGWTRTNLARTHSRPGPVPAQVLRKFKQQAAIAASEGGYPAGQLC